MSSIIYHLRNIYSILSMRPEIQIEIFGKCSLDGWTRCMTYYTVANPNLCTVNCPRKQSH